MEKTVYGWGINDVEYPVQKFIKEGKKNIFVSVCPYYLRWKNMVKRVFDKNLMYTETSYSDCTVCEEWKYLSNFIKWVDSQPNRDWQNCQLDKDVLLDGNRVYGPKTCAFVSRQVNMFCHDRKACRGAYKIGVTKRKDNNKFRAFCRNPFTCKQDKIGQFDTEIEAHTAWQTRKHEYAIVLADLQPDERVAKALRERYAADKDWTNR